MKQWKQIFFPCLINTHPFSCECANILLYGWPNRNYFFKSKTIFKFTSNIQVIWTIVNNDWRWTKKLIRIVTKYIILIQIQKYEEYFATYYWIWMQNISWEWNDWTGSLANKRKNILLTGFLTLLVNTLTALRTLCR